MDVTTQFGTVRIKLLKGDTGEQGIQGIQGVQGIQGEPFEFEDFTEEQLAELRADVATVYCKKLETTIYTTGDNTTSIEIPFEDYMTNDMLFVDIEGLALTEGTDYTISNGSIVLTTPITHHYTAVNFRLLRFIAMSTEDFDNLTGDIDAKIATDVDAWLTAHPEATTTVADGAVTTAKLADGAVTDAKLVQSGGILEAFNDYAEKAEIGSESKTYDSLSGRYVRYSTGAVTSASGWSTANENNNARIKIPDYCTRIVFENAEFRVGSNGGWATYSSDSGSATTYYLRGGQTNYIDVQDGDEYFAVSSAAIDGVELSTFTVTYYYGKPSESIRRIDRVLTGSEIATYSSLSNTFIDSANGGVSSNANYSVAAYNNNARIKIPDYCTRIVFEGIAVDFDGTAGWATYSANAGSATTYYLRGGQTNYIDVQEGEKYFAVTSYKIGGEFVTSFKVTFYFGTASVLAYEAAHPISDKVIAFVGDSVTYGYDDDNSGAQLENPFPKQVGELLGSLWVNEGVSSASLMDGLTAGGTQTPKAWAIDYTELNDAYDIVGVMIGINDCYRNYALGTFEDRTVNTFYGALHVFWQGMLAKYLPEDGKHLFSIIYPHYDVVATWDDFVNAMVEVAQYYSIPILDLRYEMGVSCYADSTYKYWRTTTGGHSPHLTQIGADVVSPVIASYVKRMF